MRIIGGDHRGRKLASPPDKNIRPTSDRMRETIFNILSHSGISLRGANVLDVFAGTGALGLEALSRGAAHVTFFDKDRKSLQLVKKNVALLKAADRTTIRCIEVPKLPPSRTRFDFIFLDPPYNLDVISDTIIALDKKGYLSDDYIIVAEYSSDNTLIVPDFLNITKEKVYGEARFSFLIKEYD
ncbi:MAG: 16S rRNA (guanine(966)-N(2))-methyltransferase RsmD [Emcibacter sp.]|nr:16S rRNA (guanine(966)-N(2))-methyltransferase RsmD [Emcibacter sp.]